MTLSTKNKKFSLKVTLGSSNSPLKSGLSNDTKGILWKLFSCFCFASINGIVRYLTGGSHYAPQHVLSASTLVFYQNLFAVLYILPLFFKKGLPKLSTQHFLLHFLRILTSVTGILLWYCALEKTPITQALALNFTGPIFTIIGAWLYLKEPFTKARIYSVILCFAGAFIITRPDQMFTKNSSDAATHFWMLLPLLSAIAIALSKLYTRKLAVTGVSSTSLTTYLLLFMLPVSLVPAMMDWSPVYVEHLLWLVSMGLLTLGAHYGYVKSTSYADLTTLNPYGFSKFLFGAIIGYWAFSEIPKSEYFWIGTTLIMLSILVLDKRPKHQS